MVSDLELLQVQCYCPGCEAVYLRMVESEFVNSKWAYKHEGYLVIYHDGCRHGFRGHNAKLLQNNKGVTNGWTSLSLAQVSQV